MSFNKVVVILVTLVVLGVGVGGAAYLIVWTADTNAEEAPNEVEVPDDAENENEEPERLEGWEPPEPPGAKERADERERMVKQQIADPADIRQPVTDEKVLEAMRAVPRHAFVPRRMRDRAYQDSPLPIGHGQTISQPYIVAFMTEMLDLKPGDKVLEIGTGSGYQAAVLAQLTPHVYTIEIIRELAESGGQALKEQGYDDVKVKHADGYNGWAEHGPYDAIIVTCAAGHIPPPLWEQLRPGGRMVAPIGGPYEAQRLILAEKTEDGGRRTRSLMGVQFVPLVRPPEND